MTALYTLVLSPIFVATLGFFLPRTVYKHLLIFAQTLQIALAFRLFRVVRTSGTVIEAIGRWPQGVGIRLSADRLSAPMVLLVTVMFLLFFLFNYRKKYMDNMFQFLFISLQGIMVSMFLSQDIFNIYVLTELSSIIVAVLIMYKKDKQTLYDGILYFLINLFVMAFFLLGIGFTYKTLGVLDFAGMREKLALLQSPRAVILPYALLMTAIGMKSAIFPLFSWLPRAHGAPSAPSAVSAMLSGLQVKVGVFVFLRLQGTFHPFLDSGGFFLVLGVVTAVVGFSLAICQKDIKLILAYHTVSQVGLIMMGLNSGTEAGYWGGVYHIISHALFKALLFLTAGLIIKEYGLRDVSKIRGTARRMPLVTLAAFMAVLGIIGAPFFNGSISKYLIQSGGSGAVWTIAVYLVNLGTTISFVKYSSMFFGHSDAARGTRDPFSGTVAIVVGAACLAGGIGAAPIIAYLFGYEASIAGAFGTAKFVAFGSTLAAGTGIYYLGIKRWTALEAVRKFQFSYNTIALAVTGFFASLLTFLYVIT